MQGLNGFQEAFEVLEMAEKVPGADAEVMKQYKLECKKAEKVYEFEKQESENEKITKANYDFNSSAKITEITSDD